MKSAFIILCVSLCVISLLLYSSISLNWKFLPRIIVNNFDPSLTDWTLHNANLTTARLSPLSTTINSTIVVSPVIVRAGKSSRRFAIFACSIHSSTLAYSFYAPLTVAAWERVGYITIAVFVGDFNILTGTASAQLNLTRAYLKRVGAHVLDVQCNASYAVKLSQLLRVFSGLLPGEIVRDDDNVLSTDSDLWPIRRSEYEPTPNTDGFIFNAYCCGSFKRRGRTYRMFPMGHIFLRKSTWRAMLLESEQHTELVALAGNDTRHLLSKNAPFSFETISLYARHEFGTVFDQPMTKGDSAWYMDQVLCSVMLTDYRRKHPKLIIKERGRAKRLDRLANIGFWNRDNFDEFGDAHLKHDTILQEANWKVFNKFLKYLFNETLVTIFNDYYKQFVLVGQTSLTKTRQ